MRSTATALEPTITLTMTTDEFLTLVSENVEIAQGIFRLLLETRCAPAWRTVVHGTAHARNCSAASPTALQALDGLMLLQSSPLLQRATSAELVRLAAVARVVPLAAGDTLFKAGRRRGDPRRAHRPGRRSPPRAAPPTWPKAATWSGCTKRSAAAS